MVGVCIDEDWTMSMSRTMCWTCLILSPRPGSKHRWPSCYGNSVILDLSWPLIQLLNFLGPDSTPCEPSNCIVCYTPYVYWNWLIFLFFFFFRFSFWFCWDGIYNKQHQLDHKVSFICLTASFIFVNKLKFSSFVLYKDWQWHFLYFHLNTRPIFINGLQLGLHYVCMFELLFDLIFLNFWRLERIYRRTKT